MTVSYAYRSFTIFNAIFIFIDATSNIWPLIIVPALVSERRQ